MPRPTPQHVLARRALIEEHPARLPWVRQGAAAVGISVLGLAVAGSVAATGNGQDSLPPPSAAVDALPAARDSAPGQRLDEHLAAQLRTRRAGQDRAAQRQALGDRRESLKAAAHAADQAAAAPDHARAARTAARRVREKSAPPRSSGRASLPITSGYHLAARFGQTGVWSRYHTGLDFAAPRGTRIRAMVAGVVTHAGSGSAGWAGRYVTIRHADGKTTLYAHMSSASVHAGERVSGGQRIGAVGMTGRTFGPHVHVELYPRGVRPGKVYSATNPAPWMRAHGLHI